MSAPTRVIKVSRDSRETARDRRKARDIRATEYLRSIENRAPKYYSINQNKGIIL